VVKLLIEEFRADVNCQDAKGNTPLHITTSKSNKRILKLLLERNPMLTIMNSQGLTPSHLAKDAQIKIEMKEYEMRMEKLAS